MQQPINYSEAIKARNVRLFEVFTKSCGDDELVDLSHAVVMCAKQAVAETSPFAKDKYEDMMVCGLKRIVELSTFESGLELNSLRSESTIPGCEVIHPIKEKDNWRLRKNELSLCLKVINKFVLEKNILAILNHKNGDGVTFLSFCRFVLDRATYDDFSGINKVVDKHFPEFTVKEDSAPGIVKAALREGKVNTMKLLRLAWGWTSMKLLVETCRHVPYFRSDIDIGSRYYEVFNNVMLLDFLVKHNGILERKESLAKEDVKEYLQRLLINSRDENESVQYLRRRLFRELVTIGCIRKVQGSFFARLPRDVVNLIMVHVEGNVRRVKNSEGKFVTKSWLLK